MDGTSYGKYQIEILSGEAQFNRSLGAGSCHWEKAAQEALSKETYGYLAGGAGEGATMDSNRIAFRRWRIVPRMLRQNRHRDLSIEIFGKKLPSPVIMAPVAANKLVCYRLLSTTEAFPADFGAVST
jgi:lactate 2-monooxygenase